LITQKLTLSSDSILIPRRLEERDQDRLQSIYRILQKTYIEGDLDLHNIPITDLGNLQSVGGSLWLINTPISRLSKRERDKILSKVKIEGRVLY